MIRQRLCAKCHPGLFSLPYNFPLHFAQASTHSSVALFRTLHGHAKLPFHKRMIRLLSTLKVDPHNYTTGRWLRHDKKERDRRYIGFDFSALCARIFELCPGADSISHCKKIEGGFNRVFIFTLNNSTRIVARLPFALAGPSRLTTSSEVATIKYRELGLTKYYQKV